MAGAGVFVGARGPPPGGGAWALGTSLVLALAISALVISPWPRWEIFDTQGPSLQTPRAKVVASSTVEAPHMPLLLVDAQPDYPVASSGWRWPAWLAVALLAGGLLALLRLLVAIWAASMLCRRAAPLNDLPVQRLLAELLASFNVSRSIELRQIPLRCSPATVGWWRPVIILPSDWQTWSDDERRAVLAHEIAHIARHDFAIGLLAQLAVALHFYNPLVHWLARHLRLEQEMAADVWGAQLAGGRQRYLATLAEMALHTDDAPLAWAAQPFLPTRGTLMRRIEMLHQESGLTSLSVSRMRRLVLTGLLVLVASTVVGLRGEATGSAFAAGPENDNVRKNESINKLKDIGIALNFYHNVNKHFPPAVVMGPDGKTPHSWRVELLPYLDKRELFNNYRMDEPWDSDHNRALIAEGAELFSVPSDVPTQDCGYFAIVGSGTAFDPEKGPITIRRVVDGTSKTIAIVEAKHSIPWTKPQDIAYAADQPLPALGGFFPGGFHAVWLDAHVSFLPDSIPADYLKAVISYDGREATSFDPQTGGYKVVKPPAPRRK